MHSIISLYNFIASYLNVYIVLDVCHEIFFYYFPSSCLKSKHIAMYHNRVILMHVIVDQIYIIQKVAIILDLHKGIEI